MNTPPVMRMTATTRARARGPTRSSPAKIRNGYDIAVSVRSTFIGGSKSQHYHARPRGDTRSRQVPSGQATVKKRHDFTRLRVESVLHSTFWRDEDTHSRRFARARPRRLRADAPGLCRPAPGGGRIAAGRRVPRSLADGARAAVPASDRAREGLQDRICDRPNRSRQRLELAGDHLAVPLLHPLPHRGRAQDAGGPIDVDDRTRARPPRLASHARARHAAADRVPGTVAGNPGAGAGGRSLRRRPPEADAI